MTDKKFGIWKVRKLRWIRKKTLYTQFLLEYGDIWKAMIQLQKKVNNIKGEIKADLFLKELDNGKWNVIISVDGKTHVDLKGHLNLVLNNIQLFKRVYDFEKSIKNEIKSDSKVGKKNCDGCHLWGECDHQGAYQVNGKWCYEMLDTKKSDRIKRFKLGMTKDEYEKYKKGENWVYQEEESSELESKCEGCELVAHQRSGKKMKICLHKSFGFKAQIIEKGFKCPKNKQREDKTK